MKRTPDDRNVATQHAGHYSWVRWRGRLAMLIATILIALGALVLFAWWMQERITFQPPSPPFDDAGETRRVAYTAKDGAELFAYLVGDSSSDNLVLAFHGNADLAVWQIPWAQELTARTGWLVMLVEYRGYGGAPGAPSYSNAQLDARAALAYATDSLGIAPSHMAYFGHSLGSGVATELAAESPPGSLVLQSPFTSARDMARIIVAPPIAMAWRLISRVHYDTERLLGTITTPVHVAHGDRDLVVPSRMGRRVYAAAKSKGQLLIVTGAGHNNVEDHGGQSYWDWLIAAVTSVPVD